MLGFFHYLLKVIPHYIYNFFLFILFGNSNLNDFMKQ
jgi:hypothetical protein